MVVGSEQRNQADLEKAKHVFFFLRWQEHEQPFVFISKICAW